MDKIKTLIADDEDIIRNGIKKMVNEHGGFCVIQEANNGKKALELIQDTRPDVALVDINMPYVNGLDFVRELKNISPSTVVVMITGYDDFEYAQKSINLGVFEYMLKPIKKNLFFELLDKISLKFYKQKESFNYLEFAKTQLLKNKDFLVNEFLKNILSDNLDEEEIQLQESILEVTIPKDFVIFKLKFLTNDSIIRDPSWDYNLAFYSVKNKIEKLFSSTVFIYRDGESEFVLITTSLNLVELSNLKDLINKIISDTLKIEALVIFNKGVGYEEYKNVYSDLLDKEEALIKLPHKILESQVFIREHYYNPNINLTMVAEALLVTPQYLSRLFKYSINMSFVEFLTQIRIDKSIELLENEEKKIYEIAEEVGYSSQHYFCTAFKRVKHMSPLEYRKIYYNWNFK